MSYPTEEIEVKVSSEGAQSFVDWYYRDLNDHRPMSNYYVNSSTKYTSAGVTADITINGAHLASPGEYEALLEEQRGASKINGAGSSRKPTASRVRWDVDNYDSQVINDDFGLGCPEHILSRGPDRTGGRISILVSVMGTVHLGTGTSAQHKIFNEVFVLVPNWDARGRNAPRNAKRFLISSQNYRTL